MSSLSDFLIGDYASHFRVTWDSDTMEVRREKPLSKIFEIEDKKQTIVQPAGQGVSVIVRTDDVVEVVDLEDFTKTIHGETNTPSCCDFVITPCVGTDFLLLNELTKSQSKYILPFKQPTTGLMKDGKLEKAKHQLTTTINRFYEVSNFCDQYLEKTALFSCRLSDMNKKSIMAQSAQSFTRFINKIQKMRLHQKLPHGFIFKMRVYNQPYVIK